jgi:fructose-1,6-bisphosphatase/inositol monophosphatase family enzyme
MDVDAVTALIEDVAASTVLPRWRSLAEGEVDEKGPGDLVTVADREAEALLTRGLTALLPDVPVVGEEATAADPSLPDLLATAPAAWLVDPVDGTGNFVAGRREFAVMVALVRDGESVASWIHRPTEGTTYVAERGAGAFRDGVRLHRAPAAPDLGALTGAALQRHLPDEHRRRVVEQASRFGVLGPGLVCAGVEYALLAEGGQDFVLFWRTMPWDHAPGSLLLREAGGAVVHLDGAPYRVGAPRTGLLAAADAGTAERVLQVLGDAEPARPRRSVGGSPEEER